MMEQNTHMIPMVTQAESPRTPKIVEAKNKGRGKTKIEITTWESVERSITSFKLGASVNAHQKNGTYGSKSEGFLQFNWVHVF
jgi:hypothetical protein